MEKASNKFYNIIKSLSKALMVLFIIVIAFSAFYIGMDFIFKGVFSPTSRAVLSNFMVFAALIAYVMYNFVHPKAVFEKMQTVIEDEIKCSDVAREESEARLDAVQKSSRNVKKEINNILKKSKENAQLVGAKIIEEAENTALVIKDNVEKVVENNLTLLKNDLIKRASLASVEIAKTQIINELNNNQELHNKLIDESIESIIVEEEIEEV